MTLFLLFFVTPSIRRQVGPSGPSTLRRWPPPSVTQSFPHETGAVDALGFRPVNFGAEHELATESPDVCVHRTERVGRRSALGIRPHRLRDPLFLSGQALAIQ